MWGQIAEIPIYLNFKKTYRYAYGEQGKIILQLYYFKSEKTQT